MTEKFPKRIFVVREYDKDGVYFITHKTIEDIREDYAGEMIAIYELVEQKKLVVDKNLR